MQLPEPIRLVLVDDHLVVRKGIVLILEDVPDMTVVGEAGTGEEAIKLTAELRPDIILMDVKMEGIDGAEATRTIVQANPSMRVIGLSSFVSRDVVSGMIEAGARGYLLKDISASELISAIRRIHLGEIIYPDELLQPVVAEASDGQSLANGEPDPILGAQQKRVLALMTKGFTNPEIAERMGFSNPTARYHVSAILRKLEVSNRSEAVAVAIRLGLVGVDDF